MSPSKDSIPGVPGASVPKMVIKGFTLNSKPGARPLSFATKNTPHGSQSSGLGKRMRTALHDGSEDEDEKIVQHEAVTGFDIREGGALRKNEATVNGPLIIPKTKSRDWREEIRQSRMKRKNLLPPEVQAQRRAVEHTKPSDGGKDRMGDEEIQWGLTLKKKTAVVEQDGGDKIEELVDDTDVAVVAATEVLVEDLREKTDDEIALDALMGVKAEKKGLDLIIPAASANVDNDYSRPMNEDDAYRRAIRIAPEVSTLEDYERVPVEEFGAALLRGMGWKEGDDKKGRVDRPKEVKRRQNLLGLGATELKGAEELGAWVQKSDPKRLGTGGSRGERRPKANEYREREQMKRENRDDKYGGSHRSYRDDYRDRDRDRRR